MPRVLITDEVRNSIWRLAQSKVTNKENARRHGITLRSVEKVLSDMRGPVGPRWRPIGPDMQTRIREMVASGMKHSAIARELGICKNSVYRTLKKQRGDGLQPFRRLVRYKTCDGCRQRVAYWPCVYCAAVEHRKQCGRVL